VSPTTRRTAASLAAGLAAISALTLSGSAAQAQAAQTAPTNGLLAYFADDSGGGSHGALYVANTNGTDARKTAAPADEFVWSPDGSRIFYSSQDASGVAIYSIRPDGTDRTLVADKDVSGFALQTPTADFAVDATGTGTRLEYATTTGTIDAVPADGSDPGNPTQLYDASGISGTSGAVIVSFVLDPINGEPIAALDNGGLYAFGPGDEPGDEQTPLASCTAAYGPEPLVSPNGSQLAYLCGTGPVQLLLGSLTYSGSGASTLVTGLAAPSSVLATGQVVNSLNQQPEIGQWTPAGTGITANDFDSTNTAKAFSPTGGATVTLPAPSGSGDVQYQPVTAGLTPAPNNVVRVWGGVAAQTAIAVSQYSYDSYPGASGARRADAVVLARSDAYYDSLAGALLAAQKQAPLLLTPPSNLASDVAAEIRRVLAPGGTVYVLGGPAALSPAVAAQVTALGYKADRLAGGDMYGTAIAVDQAITSGEPTRIVLATGTSYYDALSSVTLTGSTADKSTGGDGPTVLVLSRGTALPSASLAYLKSQCNKGELEDACLLVGVGGPGSQAITTADHEGVNVQGVLRYVGATAKDTALLVAGTDTDLSAGPSMIGVATDTGWYDALSGGAMVGHEDGALLLTDPATLYAKDTAYIAGVPTGYIGEIDMFGGPAALSQSLVTPLGTALSHGWSWDYTSFTPGSPVPPFAQ
jgi:hypothetical protein